MALLVSGMDLNQFVESVQSESAPEEASGALLALWWDAKGDWNQAHELAQAAGSSDGDWVHAYLHRKEGDEGNASYWYARARQPIYEGTLPEEWLHIANHLLKRQF